jgi:hypothetical protein
MACSRGCVKGSACLASVLGQRQSGAASCFSSTADAGGGRRGVARARHRRWPPGHPATHSPAHTLPYPVSLLRGRWATRARASRRCRSAASAPCCAICRAWPPASTRRLPPMRCRAARSPCCRRAPSQARACSTPSCFVAHPQRARGPGQRGRARGADGSDQMLPAEVWWGWGIQALMVQSDAPCRHCSRAPQALRAARVASGRLSNASAMLPAVLHAARHERTHGGH